jgi:hypothetical protein
MKLKEKEITVYTFNKLFRECVAFYEALGYNSDKQIELARRELQRKYPEVLSR